ncbi:MAG: hypothetical protein HOW73_32780 [Polyangiaceae bacterium]|nr:hypothetical protein [Polyangiaceae bacterium]
MKRLFGAKPLATLVAAASLFVSLAADAAPWKPHAPGESPPTQEQIDEASKRYQKGIQLYEVEGDVASALIELQRAYDTAPNYQVLFNIGQVARTARDYTTSKRAFEAYLQFGGANVPPEKKQQVETELKALKELVSTITITTTSTSGTLLVDGSEYGKLPLGEPVLVNPGSHKIELQTESGTATQTLTVAGGDERTIDLTVKVEISKPPPVTAPVTKVEEGPSYVWAGWLVSGLLGAGAIATGSVALVQRSDLDDKAYFGTEPPADLEDQKSRVTGLAIATDVLIGAAVLSAGVTLYFTIKESSSDDEAAPATTALRVSPNGLALTGTF